MTTTERLCSDCGEPVEWPAVLHRGCCAHENVQDVDKEWGSIVGWCVDCNRGVHAESDGEPGGEYWEVNE